MKSGISRTLCCKALSLFLRTVNSPSCALISISTAIVVTDRIQSSYDIPAARASADTAAAPVSASPPREDGETSESPPALGAPALGGVGG